MKLLNTSRMHRKELFNVRLKMKETSPSKQKSQDSNHECSLCEMKFSSERDKIAHVTVTHNQEKLYVCHHCNMCFSEHAALLQHLHSDSRLVTTIKDSFNICSNRCEMETKEKDPVTCDVVLQNEPEFLPSDGTNKTDSDTVPLVSCDTKKTDITLENPFPEKMQDTFRMHLLKHIKCETVLCSNNWDINSKGEIAEQTLVSNLGSQNNTEFFPAGPVHKVKEMDNKVEIKEEPWWLETQRSNVFDDIKDGMSPPVQFQRLPTEAVFGESCGKSPLPSAEVSVKDTSFFNRKDHPKYIVTEIPNLKEYISAEKFGAYNYGDEIYNRSLHLKQENLNHKGEKPHKCSICDKRFTRLSHLKSHEFLHGTERPYKCQICGKGFTASPGLKRHNLIHEGKKPHKCSICEKSFTMMSNLKAHVLIHEGIKLYKCAVCYKRFSGSSDLKRHKMIHEGKKPLECKFCEKRFAVLSHFRRHNLIHEGNLYRCETCDKKFTALSSLKMHNMIHEGKRPHRCEVCDKRFTQRSSLKVHSLIHEGRKPFTCSTCYKSFTQMPHLKRHNLIHQCQKVLQT